MFKKFSRSLLIKYWSKTLICLFFSIWLSLLCEYLVRISSIRLIQKFSSLKRLLTLLVSLANPSQLISSSNSACLTFWDFKSKIPKSLALVIIAVLSIFLNSIEDPEILCAFGLRTETKYLLKQRSIVLLTTSLLFASQFELFFFGWNIEFSSFSILHAELILLEPKSCSTTETSRFTTFGENFEFESVTNPLLSCCSLLKFTSHKSFGLSHLCIMVNELD